MEQEKKCKNCKYYVAHYAKCDTSFHQLLDGHCTNRDLNQSRKRNKYQLYENCTYWESNEDTKKERKESIITVIRNMRERLIHIEQILSDDL